jgi:hypothetical protein
VETLVTAFRILLAAIFAVLAAYTALVISRHGANLLPVFFGDIARMEWPGQFNLDFLSLLTLSGLWIAWRHRFTPAGLALGVCGLFGGGLFLSAFLLVQSFRTGGDMRALLLAPDRARR